MAIPTLSKSVLCLAAALPLAACAAQMEEDTAAELAENVPPARVVGEPVNCIQTTRIRSSNVRNDQVIDFDMLGGPTYRTTLPYSCSGLGFERSFAYETSISQLCSTDIIYVLDSTGSRRASCGLGEFVPVELLRED